MEQTTQNKMPQENPRRKKRSRMQTFKEAYLPVIIVGAALLLIIIFIAGSITRSVQKKRAEKEASIAASQQVASEAAKLAKEAEDLLQQAQLRAEAYAYKEAIAIIDSFTGEIDQFPELAAKRTEYAEAQKNLNVWSDPSQIPNLSFHMLVADPVRAYQDSDYGSSYVTNFVTTAEFSAILEQLYANDYVLVSLSDFTETDEDGQYVSKKLYLPAGKKPVMITQTGVNYYSYMTDSDGDGVADKDAAGFASGLIVAADGSFTNSYVTAEGKLVYGDYDLVPILENFIAAHPDFSFNGARATLAITGYDGVFGYRTNPSAKDKYGEDAYEQALADATTLIGTLRHAGYTIACYTYDNIPYGDVSVTEIQTDLSYWQTEVQDVFGLFDTLVFARTSDISEPGAYAGEKFEVLKNAGFRNFLGFCDDGQTWMHIGADYIRQGRILVTGTNITQRPDWFQDLFDATSLLDPARASE